MSGRRLVLGIDGGGTKTACLAADHRGKPLARGRSGPSNLRLLGVEGAIRAASEAARKALESLGSTPAEVDAAYAGLAGIGGTDTGRLASLLKAALGLGDHAIVRVDNDAAVALAGATGGRPGIVVLSGTGSIAFGMDARGNRARAGGWGWLFGDEGSGYDVGRKALMAVARAHDGRGPETALTGAVIGHLGLKSPEDMVEVFYGRKLRPSEVASLAPLVIRAAETGDREARRILREAGRELGRAAAAVAVRLHLARQVFEIATAGGLLGASSIMRGSLARELRSTAPHAEFIEPRMGPAEGAVLLALKELNGRNLGESFDGATESGYRRA